jgi:hypothetical protein
LKPGAIDTFLRRGWIYSTRRPAATRRNEFASETDAAVFRAILKVKGGAGGGLVGGMRLLRGGLAGCVLR